MLVSWGKGEGKRAINKLMMVPTVPPVLDLA